MCDCAREYALVCVWGWGRVVLFWKILEKFFETILIAPLCGD